MGNLKILQIYDHMQLGGAETHIITLSKGLIDSGNVVHIASSNGPAVPVIKKLGIEFHELDLYNSDHYILNAGKLLEIIENHQIDIVHAHPFHSQIIISLVKLLKNVPTITTIHGPYETPSVKGLNKFYDGFILVSEETKRFHYEKKLLNHKHHIEIIPNSVPILSSDTILNLRKGSLKIAYVSRIDADKLPSILFFIKCIEIAIKHFNLEILIIGQGSKLQDVSKLARGVNLKAQKNIISVVDGSTDVINEIKNVDIVVGVGRVILEALSINKIPVCIGNNNYVGIVNSKNIKKIAEVNFTDRNTTQTLSPELFIDDLKRIVNFSEEVIKELKETVTYFKKHYDIKISVEKHLKFYKKILNNYSYNRIYDIQDIVTFKPKIKFIEDFDFVRYLRSRGFKYQLDDVKDTKILIMPDFFNENDCWNKVLRHFLENYNDSITILIRVKNEYIIDLGEIIRKIQSEIEKYNNGPRTDILIDCEFHDSVNELLFLYEMDIFIPTNDYQQDITYKCRLLEKIVKYDI